MESEIERIYGWLFMDNRPKAQTYFKEGGARNLAKEIEFRLSKPNVTEIKSANIEKQAYLLYPNKDMSKVTNGTDYNPALREDYIKGALSLSQDNSKEAVEFLNWVWSYKYTDNNEAQELYDLYLKTKNLKSE